MKILQLLFVSFVAICVCSQSAAEDKVAKLDGYYNF
jgi:hypothetical protein